MSFTVHTDEPHAVYDANQRAAREVGCFEDDDADEDRTGGFFIGVAWALGISAVVWGALLIWVYA